jgi:hypothetical protein
VFVVGTLIRTRAEERLLRAQFGAAYEAYAARVPALIPFAWHAGGHRLPALCQLHLYPARTCSAR